MKHSNPTNVHAQGVVKDNLTLSRMVIDLINRYLAEPDERRRAQIFSEISQLRDISSILNCGK